MSKRKILIILFLFAALLLSAQNVQYGNNNYIISESNYKLNNKTYIAYKYFITKENLLSERFDTVYLMIASPSTQSIGSFGGHTFIVLSKEDDLTNSVAINLYGIHETLSTFQKAVIGSTKGLPGYIDIRPFSQIAERYTIGQERTIFHYKMDINKEGVVLLIDRLYELAEEQLSYQFFTNNCADLSLLLFEAAINRNLSDETPFMLIPSYLPVIMERNNLILEKGTLSPPIIRMSKEVLYISKEMIKEKKSFYDENLNETTSMNNSERFIPQTDLYDYGTKLDSFISQFSLGTINNNLALTLSVFATNRYEQRQSPTHALQINFLQIGIIYDDAFKVDSFIFFEFSSYPKINYSFEFTKKLMIIGKRDFNDNLQPIIKFGSGISLGNSNLLLDLTADVDIPLSKFGINLSVNGEVVFYNKNAYVLFECNFPYYKKNFNNVISLKSKAGITIFNRLDFECNYNWFEQNFGTLITWNFNPSLK